MPRQRVCPFCQKDFVPSHYHPNQTVCSAGECQKKRRSAYHRNKVQEDPAYAEQCRESRKKWRDSNKARMAEYRKLRRRRAATNVTQTTDIRRQRLRSLIDQSLVFNLRQCHAELWLLCPADQDEVENILATANLLILHADLSSSR